MYVSGRVVVGMDAPTYIDAPTFTFLPPNPRANWACWPRRLWSARTIDIKQFKLQNGEKLFTGLTGVTYHIIVPETPNRSRLDRAAIVA
jgi:hypothetical protein